MGISVDKSLTKKSIVEDSLVFLLQHEVDSNHIHVVGMGELHDRSGLSHLSGTLYDEWQMVSPFFPIF